MVSYEVNVFYVFNVYNGLQEVDAAYQISCRITELMEKGFSIRRCEEGCYAKDYFMVYFVHIYFKNEEDEFRYRLEYGND